VTSETIRVERGDRTATVIVDRPPLNVLDIPTLKQLRRVVDELGDEGDLALLVVRGAGEKGFSAGVSVHDHTPDKVDLMLEIFHGALRRLRDLDAVTVAAVHGHCLGGGMELAMACDFLVATDDARFGQPEIELGCYPPYAAALYPSLLGAGRTLDLLLTGRNLSADEAERLGIVTHRAAKGSLDAALATLAGQLLAKSTAVLRLTKKVVRAGRDLPFDEAFAEAERTYLRELCATADMQEGIASFLEKRKPAWKHR
jgi:cyclohexa-1,5-dienecarbonyl-CoA hydratase